MWSSQPPGLDFCNGNFIVLGMFDSKYIHCYSERVYKTEF